MAVESPVSVAVISRLPEAKTNTAAFLIVMALALWIESPVIDLLATSNTLSRGKRSASCMLRFVKWIMAGVTAVHVLVVATPLYELVTLGLLALPREVAEAARGGLTIMIPWSALIGWRRALQGILIHEGHTRVIGFGTFLRVAVMALTALGLAVFSPLGGIEIAASSLIASVGAEALFVHIVARPVVERMLARDDPSGPDLTLGRIARFHFPLTGTTMVTLSAAPIMSAAISQSPEPVLGLAAWQVASTLLWLMRCTAFALPEVVITLARDERATAALARFCLEVGLVLSSLTLLFGLTGLDRWFFMRVLSARPEIAGAAHVGFLAASLTPLLGAVMAFYRGVLTRAHLTSARLKAILVSLGCLAVGLWIGVRVQAPGVLAAALALTTALVAEYLTLLSAWATAKRRRESPVAPA